MLKNKATLAIAGIMTLVGAIGGTAIVASAQSSTTSTNTPVTINSNIATSAVDMPESANDPVDTGTDKAQGHRPLGGDGVVVSISGTTIIVGEESNEGGASYTVDASKATFSGKDGATATLSSIKVGDKIFVEGAVSGTTVSATSISLGHGGGHADGNEQGGAQDTPEANDVPDAPSSTSATN